MSGQERLGFVEPPRGASALEALSGLIDWEPVGRWPAPLLPGGDRVKSCLAPSCDGQGVAAGDVA